MMIDLNKLYHDMKMQKFFGNFWRSPDFLLAEAELKRQGVPPLEIRDHVPSKRGEASQNLVHPFIVWAFLHWGAPAHYYRAMYKHRNPATASP